MSSDTAPRRAAPDTAGPGPSSAIDPVTLEITRSALVGIAEEAGAALRRTAYSPNIKERMDASTAIFDASARLVAQAAHIPVHLGSMPASVEAALATFPSLAPGDQVLLSDPYAGGTHLPDWTLVAPIHADDGRLLGYAANRAHHADVSGMTPGSMPPGATEIFQEGLRIPPVRLVREGVEDPDLRRMLLLNSRTPDERVGDLRAQVGANLLTARRVAELAAAMGADRFDAACSATLDHAEHLVRAAIAALPDGTWSAADALDGDGVVAFDATDDEPIPLRCALTIAGDALRLDFTGTSSQVAGGVNAPAAVTLSACWYAVRAIVAPDVPTNEGTARPIEVIVEHGSVLDPRPPASVAGGNCETSQRVVDVVFAALAQVVPDRVPAASQGTMNNTTMGGVDPRTDRGFTYYETLGGGQGALPGLDGMSGVHTHMTNTRNTPIEAFELAYPLRITAYHLRDGTGGAGASHGGDGLVRQVEVLTDHVTCSLLTERRATGPPGLAGGAPGAPGANSVRRAGSEVDEPLPAKTTLDLRRGDRLTVATPAGGGHGPPS